MQIKEIQLTNVFGYKNKTLTFEKDQRTLVIGRNNSGKSAFADAVCFTLYGDWPRREKLSTVVRLGEDQAEATILFHNSMKITRTRNIRDEATLEIEGFPEIIGNRNKDKQASIDSVFGEYKTYIRTSYMMRGFLSIADPALKPAERRALLRQFFNIDSIDTATKFARSEKSQLSIAIESKKKTVQTLKEQISDTNTSNKEEIQQQLSSITEQLKNLESLFAEKEQYEKNKKELDAVTNKISSLEEKERTLQAQKPDKDKEICSLESSYKQIESHYVRLIKQAEEELSVLKERYSVINKGLPSEEEHNGKVEKYNELAEYISQNSNLAAETKLLDSEINQLKWNLENVPDAINCPECGAELALSENGAVHREKILQDIKKQIKEKRAAFEEKTKNLTEYSHKLEYFDILKTNIETINENKKKLEQIKEKGKDVKVRIDTYKNSGKSARDEFNSNVEKVSAEFDEKIKQWQKEFNIQQALFSNATILKNDLENETKLLYKEEFNSIGTKQQSFINDKHAKELELDRIIEREKRDKSLKQSIKNEEKEISNLTTIVNNVDFWITHFPVVEKVLLEDSISLLELETNRWLQKLSDSYSIEFELKNKGVYATVYENGIAWELSQMGSGIGSRVALASTFALMSVLKKVNTTVQYVFIDEALDNLDVEGVEAFADLLNYVDGQRFVISHHDVLKNSNFDAIYEAKKIDDTSILEKQ